MEVASIAFDDFHAQVLVLADRLVLSFYDDAVGSDNLVGSLVLSVKKLIQLGKRPNGFT